MPKAAAIQEQTPDTSQSVAEEIENTALTEEEEEQASRPSAAGPGGPPPTIVEPEREDWMADLRMDDDGTAWAEDQNGNWYYQEPGSNDWESWDD